jgi:hypothetical protein
MCSIRSCSTGQAKPRTEESEATVALDEGTVAVLSEHQVGQRAERLAAGDGWVDSGLVFTRSDGGPYHPADVTDHFQFLVRQVGLPMTCVTVRRRWRWRRRWRRR